MANNLLANVVGEFTQSNFTIIKDTKHDASEVTPFARCFDFIEYIVKNQLKRSFGFQVEAITIASNFERCSLCGAHVNLCLLELLIHRMFQFLYPRTGISLSIKGSTYNFTTTYPEETLTYKNDQHAY